MGKDAFFTMRVPFEKMNVDQFALALRTSGHIKDVLYEPDVLEDKTINDIEFQNVSLSKTHIQRITFNRCTFRNCLFIGTEFEEVGFHSCSFIDCNFFRSKFKQVYAKPAQFAQAVRKHSYANVAVGLFQGLRDNYSDTMQPEHRREAEYFFQVWSRRLKWSEIMSSSTKIRSALAWFGSLAYGNLFGYGYRLRNLLITTSVVVVLLTCAAHSFHQILFEENGVVSVVRSLYFTVSTMVTMGAVGFTPVTSSGYLFVLLNALCGIVLITATVSAIAKRVAR